MGLGALLVEVFASVAREIRRIAPMAAGIVWGVASVFVLVAISRGFEATQRQALESLGDEFLLLRVNRATSQRGGPQSSAFLQLDHEDIDAMRTGAPSVAALSPKAFAWRTRVFRGQESGFITAVGVEPGYRDICHVPLEPGGRWIDDIDMEQELPVAVLGYGAREQLFGDAPYLGETVEVSSRGGGEDAVLRRLTVVGAVRPEELAGDSVYLSNQRVVFVPEPVAERINARGYQFFVARPRSPELKEQALAELRAVLARRHGFDPENTGTLVPYFDALERAAGIDAVFGGLEVFLTAVGSLILLLGAVGVANVVLMSVTARTFEFGLRRALGAKRRWIFAQVFLEAACVCVASGVLGFLLGLAGVQALGSIELPEGFAAPRAELSAAILPGVLLLSVSLVAAAWPATRAARLPVVAALRGGRL